MTTTTPFQLGSISHGTLRPEDLLPAFADTLESFNPSDDLVQEARKVWEDLGNDKPDADELASEIINDLIDTIQCFCPPFVYFGAIEGDGSGFGFWPDIDSLEEARRYAIMKDADYWTLPDDYEFLEEDNVWVHVNDHGNVTVLTNNDGEPGEVIWECV